MVRPDDVAALVQTSPQIVRVLGETGALLRGHFELQSGRYSEYFLRTAKIGWSPEHLDTTVRLLAPPAKVKRWEPNVVVCCETAAYALGFAVAQRLKLPLAVTAADPRRRPTRTVKAGSIERGARALLVTDIVTSGSSLRTLAAAARNNVAGVLAFATMSPDALRQAAADLRAPELHLAECGWPLFDEPLSVDGAPLPSAEIN